MKQLVIILSLLMIAPIQAEVVSAGQNGFIIQIERTSKASPEEAYAQFLRVSEWWNGDHSWFGDARALSIEPKVGGCFCEKDGDRQALHMLVSFVDPGKEVRMIGGLGPLQMMGVTGGMSWQFKAKETGSTIIHRYHVTGYNEQGWKDFSAIVDSVQSLQMDGLARALNK